MDYNRFQRVLRNSKRYEMDCYGRLTITDYYTGEEITLDLSLMDEDMFEQLKSDNDEEDNW